MSSSSCRALREQREQREHFYTTRTKISHYTHYTQGEFSHRVQETLQLYVELCTNKNERILHTRNVRDTRKQLSPAPDYWNQACIWRQHQS